MKTEKGANVKLAVNTRHCWDLQHRVITEHDQVSHNINLVLQWLQQKGNTVV